MFQRTPKSSPVVEPSHRADVAKRVARAYKAWCAADRLECDRLYLLFVDALRLEERAARQLQRDVSTLAAAEPVA